MIEPEQLNLIIRVRGANSLLNTIYITDYTHPGRAQLSFTVDNILKENKPVLKISL